MEGGADRARRSDPDGPRLTDLRARPAGPTRPSRGADTTTRHRGDARSKRPTAQNGQPGATRAPDGRRRNGRAGRAGAAAPLAERFGGAHVVRPESTGPPAAGPQPGSPRGDDRPGPDHGRGRPVVNPASRAGHPPRCPEQRHPGDPSRRSARPRTHPRRTVPRPYARDRRRRPTGPGQPAAPHPDQRQQRASPTRRGAPSVDRPRRAPKPGGPRRARPRPGPAPRARCGRPGHPRPGNRRACPRDTAVAAPTGAAATRVTADRTPISSPPARGRRAGIQVDEHPPMRPTWTSWRSGPGGGCRRPGCWPACSPSRLRRDGLGWAGKAWLGSAIAQVAALEPGSDAIVDADAQRGRRERADRGGPNGARPRGAATTLAVVAHVPAGGGSLTVLSFPTDSRDQPAGLQRWDTATAAYSTSRAGRRPARR